MKWILSIGIFLSSLNLYAQPSPETTFHFKIKVDTLAIKHKKSNWNLKMIKGSQYPFYYTRTFQQSDFKQDTLRFSITTKDAYLDTLIFDLVNTITKKKMKVVVSSFKDYAYFFDLKETYTGEDFDGALFFNLLEIDRLLHQSNHRDTLWKSCLITKNQQHIKIKVNDFGLRTLGGLMPYSWNKTQDKRFHNPCYDLDVNDFFVASTNSLSGKVIYKRTKHKLSGNSETIVATYVHQPNAMDRRNKLFGHSATYTFYEDHTFIARIGNPPRVVSLLPPSQIGIGTWEIQGNTLILNTPENWYSLYRSVYNLTTPMFFYNTVFKIQGNQLISPTENLKFRYTLIKAPNTKAKQKLSPEW